MNKFNAKKMILSVFSSLVLASQIWAEEGSQQSLPSADEVTARYVEVTGGIEKYKAIKNMHSIGTISIPSAGIIGKTEIKTVAPNKFNMSMEMDGAGSERAGTNGEIVWAESTMMGNRLVEGEEADQMAIEADLRRFYDPLKVYKSLKVVGIEEISGEACYKLEVERNSGNLDYNFYSIDSGLLVASKVVSESPMGKMKVDSTYSDYKDIGGIIFPHKSTMKLEASLPLETNIEEIKINIEFAKGTFDLPDSIKKIVEQKTSEK